MLRLAFKMALVNHFGYVIFHTYPKIMKFVSVETRLNEHSGNKKQIT